MITFPGLPDVDRGLFIPEQIWVVRNREFVLVSRDDTPDAWFEAVAANEPVVTHIESGMFAVSSSSMPSMMATMIEALKLEPGMRVLEIGTGTGYNAACLAALGADVVTVEVDPEIAEHARGALVKAGYPGVSVITGDGALGAPDHAPYDRVIATAAAREIPYPWIEQTRDGGLIVAPYTGQGHAGGLLVLSVADGVASGGIACEAPFMPMRGHGLTPVELRELVSDPGFRVEVTAEGQRVFSGSPPEPLGPVP